MQITSTVPFSFEGEPGFITRVAARKGLLFPEMEGEEEVIADKLAVGTSVEVIAAEAKKPVAKIEASIEIMWGKVKREATIAVRKARLHGKLKIGNDHTSKLRELFRQRRLEWQADAILKKDPSLKAVQEPYATKYVGALAPEMKSSSDLAIVLEIPLDQVEKERNRSVTDLARLGEKYAHRDRPERSKKTDENLHNRRHGRVREHA